MLRNTAFKTPLLLSVQATGKHPHVAAKLNAGTTKLRLSFPHSFSVFVRPWISSELWSQSSCFLHASVHASTAPTSGFLLNLFPWFFFLKERYEWSWTSPCKHKTHPEDEVKNRPTGFWQVTWKPTVHRVEWVHVTRWVDQSHTVTKRSGCGMRETQATGINASLWSG